MSAAATPKTPMVKVVARKANQARVLVVAAKVMAATLARLNGQGGERWPVPEGRPQPRQGACAVKAHGLPGGVPRSALVTRKALLPCSVIFSIFFIEI